MRDRRATRVQGIQQSIAANTEVTQMAAQGQPLRLTPNLRRGPVLIHERNRPTNSQRSGL